MVDCDECVELGTNVEVMRAPSEVGGGSPSEVMVCAPSEEMRGIFQDLGEGEVEGWAVSGRNVAGSVRLVGRS